MGPIVEATFEASQQGVLRRDRGDARVVPVSDLPPQDQGCGSRTLQASLCWPALRYPTWALVLPSCAWRNQ